MADPFIPKFVDLVRNFTTTQGTGNFVLGAALAGHSSLAGAVAVGELFYYTVMGVDKPAEREVGRGTMMANGTIAREPVSGPLTAFTNGTKTIALVVGANWFGDVGTWINGGAQDLAGLVTANKTSLVAAVNEVAAGGSGSGGAAGLTLTFVSAAGAVIGSTVLAVETAGYGVAGRGAARYVYDAAVNAAYVTANPRAAFLAANGRGFRLDLTQAIDLLMFGAVADNATDCLAAFQAALDYLKAGSAVGNSYQKPSGRLHLPAGRYYCSATINLKHTVHLKGETSGLTGGAATQIRFPINTAGIVVNTHQTLGYTTITPADTNAEGSIVEGLMLTGGGGSSANNADGILMRSRALIKDCQITGFARDGISISAASDANGAYLGNANLWRIEQCYVSFNGRHGLYVIGADANAGTCIGLNSSFNVRWGVLDNSFLGNTYIGCHTDSNGISSDFSLINGCVSYPASGQRYTIAYGQEGVAGTTTPGTNAAIWIPIVGSAGGRTWGPAVVVESGGSYGSQSATATNVFIGCYAENGQAAQMIAPAQVYSAGSFGQINGTVVVTYNSQGRLATNRGFIAVQSRSIDNGVIRAALGTDANNGNLLEFAADNLWNGTHRLVYQGGDFIWQRDSVFAAYRITTNLTPLNMGRSTAQQDKFVTEEIALGIGNNSRFLTYGTAAPTTGNHAAGEIVFNNGPVAGGSMGWMCVSAGTPGTWKAMPNLAP